jgi:flagellar FliL protein
MSDNPDKAKGKKKSKLLFIIIGVVFLLVIGGMAGGFFLMWTKISTMSAAVENPSQANASVAEASQAVPIGVTYPMQTFILNLADEKGIRYLKVRIELEVANGVETAQLDNRVPQMRDKILMTLTTKTLEDVITSAGKDSLRKELIDQLNAFSNQKLITNLYFTEFVIQ